MRTVLNASVNLVPYRIRPLVKRMPGVAALQRLVVRAFMSGVPFVHRINAGPVRGLQFEVTLPEDKAIWAGTYETDFAEAIAVGVKPGDVCYDIGGYRGYMAAAMALAGASKVVIFEPHPDNQNAIRRLISLNPALPIELERVAVGSDDGTLQLRIMPELSMAKLETSSFQQDTPAVGQIDVAVRSIDSLVSSGQLPPPALMKIDVEGAEADVLRGGEATLRSHRPKLFLEIHTADLEKACVRHLTEFGYDLRRLSATPKADDDVRHFVGLPQ